MFDFKIFHFLMELKAFFNIFFKFLTADWSIKDYV